MTSNELAKFTPGKGISRLDANILRLAANGKSPKEIGAELHLPAEQVMLRAREILESRDVWSERERFLLYMQDLYELKDDLQKQAKNDPGNARTVSNLIRALEQLGKSLERVSKINNELDDAISTQHAKQMLSWIVQAFNYAQHTLEEQYPELPWQTIDEKFREGLVNVATFDDQ